MKFPFAIWFEHRFYSSFDVIAPAVRVTMVGPHHLGWPSTSYLFGMN